IGRYTVEALAEAKDMELVGVVRRAESLGDLPLELTNVKVVSNIADLGKVDVAILCSPTRSIPEVAKALLAQGICTVDSFDIHGQPLWDLHQLLDREGKANNASAIISAGWDPGSDSVIRTLLLAMAPKGITHTNFGPGMSMGHSVVAKSKNGVKNALSMTIPTGNSVHRRMVYVELDEGANFAQIEQDIKSDDYFKKDETWVHQVTNLDELIDMGHATNIERKGVSGQTQNQLFKFQMSINNPALTAQILVSCARAVVKQRPGCYTMPEIAPMDMLPGKREDLVKSLV
ncbi:MAG: diaminopimelate dehydrogenase, partial [Bacteroidales bacterium]